MAYIGRSLTSGNYLKIDDISSSFNGTQRTFNLTSGGAPFYPGSAFSLLVSLGGVIQEAESAYTIDQNTLTFAIAPQASDDFFCIVLGVALGVGVPADGTVSGEKLSKPFEYNSGLLSLDTTNDRVGINSSIPGYTLDVNGDINFTGTFSQNGDQFVASRWSQGSGDDIYRLNGNVGVGTTNPTSALTVKGDTSLETLNVSGITTTQNLNVGTGGTVISTTSSGLVGIGTINPTSKLTVRGGDISVGINTSNGLVLTSPNGTQYRLIVNDAGALSATAI